MKNKKIITELLSCILVILVISLIANKANLSSKYTTSNRYFNLLDTNNNTPTINMSELMEEFNDLKESNDDLVRSVEQLTAEVSIIKNIKPGSVGALNRVYPLGSIYITTSSDLNTAAKVGQALGGTWEAYATDRVLKGTTTTANQEGGTTSVTLTANNIPSHTHSMAHTHAVSGTTGNPSRGHTHTVSGTTAGNNRGHTHTYSGTVASAGAHTHAASTTATTANMRIDNSWISWGDDWISHGTNRSLFGTGGTRNGYFEIPAFSATTGNQSANHTHSFSGTSGGESQNHTHTFSGTSSGESQNHTHTFSLTSGSNNDNTGSVGKSNPDAVSILDPYITVYMYKRTA